MGALPPPGSHRHANYEISHCLTPLSDERSAGGEGPINIAEIRYFLHGKGPRFDVVWHSGPRGAKFSDALSESVHYQS